MHRLSPSYWFFYAHGTLELIFCITKLFLQHSRTAFGSLTLFVIVKLPCIWLCIIISEKLYYYSVIRGMEVRWVVDLWCAEKVVLWNRNLLVLDKYSDFSFLFCIFSFFMCGGCVHVPVVLCPFSSGKKLCTVTLGQLKENKGVLSFFHNFCFT